MQILVNPLLLSRVKPPEPPEEDNQIKSKEKRQMQIKKQVLLKKMQAVRAGAGADIVASHTPDGKLVEGKKKGLDGKACWKGYKLAGTKKKGGKTVDNCVKAGFEPEGEQLEEKKAKKDYDGDGKVESGKDEYFGSRDKAIKKAMAKKGMKKEEIENLFAEIEEHHEKDKDGNTIPHKEEVKTEEWKSEAKKMTSKIMSYYGKKRDS